MAERQMCDFRICEICKRQFQVKNKKMCRKLLIKHMDLEHGVKNYIPLDVICFDPMDRTDMNDVSNNPSNDDVSKLNLWSLVNKN